MVVVSQGEEGFDPVTRRVEVREGLLSNDNPYSEAQFKTLKQRPDFPTRFGSLDDTRTCQEFCV